ncbi:hypothetical protein PLICRDRAFT_227118 [Plicaturopsis crispa FD-325 SS-3]|nr:hypothetical protein PLICRDRAFT_227118 [Plicaturopsis crispa FD-325 SS-3]
MAALPENSAETSANIGPEVQPDEHTTLLEHKITKPARTPLPKLQIGILLLVQLAEPITSQCIYPFINQLVADLPITGGDPKAVGYYAGIIESVFFVAEALTIFTWSRASDHLGRKPILLTGMFGLCISMLFFGLSRTFVQLVVSRCLAGFLNGNTGVMKSMMGEITDSTNMAEAFGWLPVTWSLGVSIGPLMGGVLSRPYEHFPVLFASPFWKAYPYFLPCGAAAAFTAFSLLVSAIFLKETITRSKPSVVDLERTLAPSPTETDRTLQAEIDLRNEQPVPLRGLLVFRVIISIANYVALALLDIAFQALLPLFYSTAIEFGGLGLSPTAIGLCMSGFGIMNGLFQGFFFAKIVNRVGGRRLFTAGMSSFLIIFGLFPVISQLAKRQGLSPMVWTVVILQLMASVVMDMAFGCVFLFITTAAPNKRSLGATNGLAQTTASIIRAVGPASATSLFAVSVERNILGGYAVYAILALVALVSLLLVQWLPERTWPQDEKVSKNGASVATA